MVRIYTLVTDVSIVGNEPTIVWNSLSNLEGDDQFLDSLFISTTQKRLNAKNQIQEKSDR
eukprot:UN00859